MALMSWATYVLQGFLQKDAKKQFGANLKRRSQFGLFPETWKYEVVIASNRKSECYGEYVNKLCTHRPSRPGILVYQK